MIKSIVRAFLTLFIVCCCILVLPAAEVDSPPVDWDQESPIDWSLFQGIPPSDASQRTGAAAIHMTIRWHASYSVSSINGATWTGHVSSVTVINTMEPTQSWVLPGKAFVSALDHEQLHFDLNEVYRRKLECMLLRVGACDGATQQEVVDLLDSSLHRTANAVLQQLSEMQTLYDSQTSHGNNSTEQSRWQSLISDWLAAPLTAP